jgi:sugar lactone lactonase YvrE
VAALVVGAAIINSYDFFERQVNDVRVFREIHPEFTLAANLAAENGDDHLIVMSSSFAGDPVMLLLADDVEVQPFSTGANVPHREAPEEDVFFILDPADSDSIDVLRFYYPDGVAEQRFDPGGALIYSTFQITREMVIDSLGLQNNIYAGGDVSGVPEETQRLATPAINWEQEQPPVDGPFTMVWQGTIFIDSYAPYSFQAVSRGSISLELDGSSLGDGQGEVSVQTEPLAIGPHSLRVTLGVDEPEGLSELRWLPPGSAEFAVVPTQALFNKDVGNLGFVTRYFPVPATEEPGVVARQVVLGPVPLVPAPYTAELIADLHIQQSGTYGFALDANQETLVFLDGVLVLERGPSAGGRVEAELTLDEGTHDIVIRYSDLTGGGDWRFEWRPPGQAVFTQPPLDIFTVPPGGVDALPTQPVVSTIDVDASWGSDGRMLEGVETPRGLALGPDGSVYILDGDGDVRVFDDSGAALRDWNTGSTEPADIAVAPDGSVYVLGSEGVLLRFDADGTLADELDGDFQAARGLAVGQDGTVYVAHASQSAILVVAPDGTLRNTIQPAEAPDGTRYLQPTDAAASPADLYSVTAEQPSIWRLSFAGAILSRWAFSPNLSNAGSHLAFANDRLIATDPGGGRVLAYDAGGQLIASGQLPPAANGERAQPVGVTASGDVVWTADLLTGRVFKLNVVTPDGPPP